MGCLNGKAKVEQEPPSGTLDSPKKLPETDPRLPLDKRQVFRLQKNWKGIKRQLQVTGVEIFARSVNNNLFSYDKIYGGYF